MAADSRNIRPWQPASGRYGVNASMTRTAHRAFARVGRTRCVGVVAARSPRCDDQGAPEPDSREAFHRVGLSAQ